MLSAQILKTQHVLQEEEEEEEMEFKLVLNKTFLEYVPAPRLSFRRSLELGSW